MQVRSGSEHGARGPSHSDLKSRRGRVGVRVVWTGRGALLVPHAHGGRASCQAHPKLSCLSVLLFPGGGRGGDLVHDMSHLAEKAGNGRRQLQANCRLPQPLPESVEDSLPVMAGESLALSSPAWTEGPCEGDLRVFLTAAALS